MLEYDRIDVSEGIDVSREFNTSHYCYFLDKGLNFQPYVCNGCHDLTQKAMGPDNVVIAYVKKNDHRIHFCYISKDEVVNFLKNVENCKI